MTPTRDEIEAVFAPWDEAVQLFAPSALPASLRGSESERILTEIGLPMGLANVLAFHGRDDALPTLAEFYSRGAGSSGANLPPEPDDAFIVFGMAGIDPLCVDPATGVIVAASSQRARRLLASSMGAFVTIVVLVAEAVLELCEDGADLSGRGLKEARKVIAAKIAEADPAGAEEAAPAWSHIVGDILAENEIFPESPDPDDVVVDLSWSSGDIAIDTTLYCPDADAAEAVRRRFARTTAVLDAMEDSRVRAKAVELVEQVGAAPAGHTSVLMVLDVATRHTDPVERESVIPALVFLGWPELVAKLDALLAAEADATVRASAQRARDLIREH